MEGFFCIQFIIQTWHLELNKKITLRRGLLKSTLQHQPQVFDIVNTQQHVYVYCVAYIYIFVFYIYSNYK